MKGKINTIQRKVYMNFFRYHTKKGRYLILDINELRDILKRKNMETKICH